MKISDLQAELEKIKEIQGDIDVVINDADTGWLFKMQPKHLDVVIDDSGTRVEIDYDYQDEIYPYPLNVTP
jgi:hypothetical protein